MTGQQQAMRKCTIYYYRQILYVHLFEVSAPIAVEV